MTNKRYIDGKTDKQGSRHIIYGGNITPLVVGEIYICRLPYALGVGGNVMLGEM